MKSSSFTVDNIDLEDEELNEAIENYNETLPKRQARLKVMRWIFPDTAIPLTLHLELIQQSDILAVIRLIIDVQKYLFLHLHIIYNILDWHLNKSIGRMFEDIFSLQVGK